MDCHPSVLITAHLAKPYHEGKIHLNRPIQQTCNGQLYAARNEALVLE